MATKNSITGDSIQTKPTTDKYRDNYDKIFARKDPKGKAKPTQAHVNKKREAKKTGDFK